MQKNFNPLIWALAIALLLIVGAAIIYLPMFGALKKTGRTIETLVGATRKTFSPIIRVDQTVVYQQQAPVLELITHKQLLQHKMEWSSTWVKSTKAITINGDFLASGGFDLKAPITVDFDTRTNTVVITHPAPRLIALELKKLNTSETDGWWNKISDDDRNAILTAFKNEARERLENDTALLENSTRDLHQQFERLLGNSGFKIEFRQAPAAPKPSPVAPPAPTATPIP